MSIFSDFFNECESNYLNTGNFITDSNIAIKQLNVLFKAQIKSCDRVTFEKELLKVHQDGNPESTLLYELLMNYESGVFSIVTDWIIKISKRKMYIDTFDLFSYVKQFSNKGFIIHIYKFIDRLNEINYHFISRRRYSYYRQLNEIGYVNYKMRCDTITQNDLEYIFTISDHLLNNLKLSNDIINIINNFHLTLTSKCIYYYIIALQNLHNVSKYSSKEIESNYMYACKYLQSIGYELTSKDHMEFLSAIYNNNYDREKAYKTMNLYIKENSLKIDLDFMKNIDDHIHCCFHEDILHFLNVDVIDDDTMCGLCRLFYDSCNKYDWLSKLKPTVKYILTQKTIKYAERVGDMDLVEFATKKIEK